MLLWYFGTLSQISTVYGSLTTAIAVLLSLEVAATLLLLGAQVIAEFERKYRQQYGFNAVTLLPATHRGSEPLRLLAAARLGRTRLIDNVAA